MTIFPFHFVNKIRETGDCRFHNQYFSIWAMHKAAVIFPCYQRFHHDLGLFLWAWLTNGGALRTWSDHHRFLDMIENLTGTR